MKYTLQFTLLFKWALLELKIFNSALGQTYSFRKFHFFGDITSPLEYVEYVHSSNVYQNTQLTTLLLTSTRIRFCTLRKWLRRWQILRWFEQISEPGFKCFSMMASPSSIPVTITIGVWIRSKWISSGWWSWWITSRWQWLVRTTWQYLTCLKKDIQ